MHSESITGAGFIRTDISRCHRLVAWSAFPGAQSRPRDHAAQVGVASDFWFAGVALLILVKSCDRRKSVTVGGVGWPEGVSPSGSHRSGRNSLPLPGSCHPGHPAVGGMLTQAQWAKNRGCL
jgi:hypothetical protein